MTVGGTTNSLSIGRGIDKTISKGGSLIPNHATITMRRAKETIGCHRMKEILATMRSEKDQHAPDQDPATIKNKG